MDEKEAKKKCSLRNEKLSKNENQGKEKVVRNRRPQEVAPGHSQKIEAR